MVQQEESNGAKNICGSLRQWLLCVVAMLLSVAGYAAPWTFSASHLSGCAPLVTSFTPSEAACEGCTYVWNLGTGGPVSGYSVSTSYVSAGSYTVTLSVYNGATLLGSSSRTVQIYAPPNVNFVVNDTDFCPGTEVRFTNTSTNSAGGYTSKLWSFGDGGFDTGNVVLHTYTSSGYYNVALTVTNSQGCSKTLSRNGYVHAFDRPQARFEQNRFSVCNPPGVIQFTSTATGTPPLTQRWEYGEGGTGIGSVVSHTYIAMGSWQATLKVTDGKGCKDSVTGPGYVTVANIAANFNGPDTICTNGTANFVNNSSTHSYRIWSFGDGATSNALNGEHTYTAAGTYDVQLIVFNSPCADTVKKRLVVIGAPAGNIIINPALPCPAPVNITFTTDAPEGTLIQWSIEPPNYSPGRTKSLTYTVDSVIKVSMIKTHPIYGCSDTLKLMDTLYDAKYKVIPDTARGCAPLRVKFNKYLTTTQPNWVSQPYPYALISETWDLGDGTIISGPIDSINHVYTDTGVYQVRLRGTTSSGCIIETGTQITVGIAPTAVFVADTTHVCKNSPVKFRAQVTSGVADSFYWDFGDYANYSLDDSFEYEFKIPGIYTVTMTPAYLGCAGPSHVITDYVRIDSPNAELSYRQSCINEREVRFMDLSMGNDNPYWDFGDGNYSTESNPVHTYAALGDYVIAFYSHNTMSGCRDTLVDSTLKIVAPRPDFRAEETNICTEKRIRFIAGDSARNSFDFRWIKEDSITDWIQDTAAHLLFNKRGRYDVTLIVLDSRGCLDTMTKVGYIVHGKPKAGFAQSSVKGCLPLVVTFSDTTRNLSGVTNTSYEWDYGDGTRVMNSSGVVNHTYTASGTYNVRQIVTNSEGCSDTAYSVVKAVKATALFETSAPTTCINGLIAFTNQSGGLGSSYWSMGDGSVAVTKDVMHSWTDTGHYSVWLAVVDTNGCTDTANKEIYIRKPRARFSVSDTVSLCVPFVAQFYNNTVGGAFYSWTMGDGNTSIVPSPGHTYTTPGIYDVRLIATDVYGCRDTAQGQVTVHGYPGSFTYATRSGCSPLTVRFSSSLSNVPYITWDFADGVTVTTSGQDTISHTYLTAGGYVPKLILSDSAGCITSAIGNDTIKVSAVDAAYGVSQTPVCPGATFALTDLSTTQWTPITTRVWEYDGNTSSASMPTHSIATPGVYSVTLKATNGWGCYDTTSGTIRVIDAGTITGDSVLCAGTTTILDNLITGGGWLSSDVLVASVDITGKVSAAQAGTTIISYLKSGCSVRKQITVQVAPTALSNKDLCEGASVMLSSAPGGGTWSTSDPSVAGVSGTGLVSALTAGSTVVSYVLSNGCARSGEVRVHAAPGPISGGSLLCVGMSVPLYNSVAGGTWTSDNPSIAAVSTSGLVSGTGVGTTNISYSMGYCNVYITVTVNAELAAVTGMNDVCSGTKDTLYNTAIGGVWTSSDTAIASIDNISGVLSGKAAGVVTITYAIASGCYDTAMVRVLGSPDAGSINGARKMCMGDTVALTNDASGGIWQNSGRHSVTNVTGLTVGISPGIDTITYTVDNGQCSSSVQHIMEINQLPDVGKVTGPRVICVNVVDTFEHNIGGGIWTSDNISVAVIDGSSGQLTTLMPGSARITYTTPADANGCVNSLVSMIRITAPEHVVTAIVKDAACAGSATGGISLMVTGTPPFAYKWSNGSSDGAISNLTAGTYTVTVLQEDTKCEVGKQITVGSTEHMTLEVQLTADTCALAKGAAIAHVTGGTPPYSTTWTDVTGTAVSGAYATALRTGKYMLHVADANGCLETDSVQIENAACQELTIYDVITPNGDGANDRWVIEGLELYTQNTVQIYDKWGDLVYEQRGYRNEWQGQTKSGNQVPDGTYYYLVRLNEPSKTGGATEYAGSILVKR